MKRVDMKDIVGCLEYIQDNQRRQDDRMNIIIDKLNYLMVQQEHIKNECKKKLNEIYGCKYYHFLPPIFLHNLKSFRLHIFQ